MKLKTEDPLRCLLNEYKQELSNMKVKDGKYLMLERTIKTLEKILEG